MTMTVSGVLADAWGLWRRDRDLIVRVAAPFLFLPALALALLAPLPVPADGAALLTAARAQGEHVSANLPGYLVALAATQFGLVLLMVLFCDPARPTLREALRRALPVWPRYVLAALMIALPELLGFLALIVPGLIVLGRTMLMGPILVGGPPLGAAAAVGRSVKATAGLTAVTTTLAAIWWGGEMIASEPLTAVDRYLRLSAPNPVALSVVDALMAGIDMLAGIASVLIAVSVYRRLASAGTAASNGI
jgi:hypothetical protein